MAMTEQQWNAFARHLQGALSRVAPDWTDRNTHDPGITVLEVLSYALTDLLLRQPPDDRVVSLARAVAEQASLLVSRYDASMQRTDPYKNFKFRVKWDGRYVAGVSKVSALKRTTDVVEYREGGDPTTTTRKRPGPRRYEAITLERGLTHDREFEAWASAAVGGNAASPQLVPKEVNIEVLDAAGQLAVSYRLWGCWVSQYQALPDLDTDRGTVLIETLRLECDGWERVAG
jgi:conserved hypothetical phage tail region protein